MDCKEELALLRKEIDETDSKLVELFCERMRISDRIGELKARNNMELTDESREQKVIETAVARAGDGYGETAAFMRSLISLSKLRQQIKLKPADEIDSIFSESAGLKKDITDQTGCNIFEICIIGLGLIGGSLAFALKDFMGAKIIGADIDPGVCSRAVKRGAVDSAQTDPRSAAKNADLVIFCVNPDQIINTIKQIEFKPGAVITEVCGIKSGLVENIRGILPHGIDYIPCHPMAGKEVDGFDNAEAELFLGKGFLIIPFEESKKKNIDLITQMAKHIGAAEISCCSADKHDEIIAYTSHLCHISALALCLEHPPDISPAFLGGSFRDCTRVANINPKLWSLLFQLNKENILQEIERFQKSIEVFKNTIKEENQEELCELIGHAARNKKALSMRS